MTSRCAGNANTPTVVWQPMSMKKTWTVTCSKIFCQTAWTEVFLVVKNQPLEQALQIIPQKS